MSFRVVLLFALCAALSLCLSALCGADTYPPDFQGIALDATFTVPTALAISPGGLVFVCEKSGVVKVYGVSLQPQPFIDLRDEVNNNGDRGLLGIALQPGFVPYDAHGGESAHDGDPELAWVYLLYAVSPEPGVDWSVGKDQRSGFSRLVRYRAIMDNGSVVADPASRQVLLGKQLPDGRVPDAIPSVAAQHSVCSMAFGEDGSLLLAAGECSRDDIVDAGGNEPWAFDSFIHPISGLYGPAPAVEDSGAFRALDLRSLAGKILRVDPGTGQGYASNPFYDGDPDSKASRIWALGLRNPFRMSVKPETGFANPDLGKPGTVYAGDVGWLQWEEINVSRGGENFGWPCNEGLNNPPEWGDRKYRDFVRGSDPLGRPDCSSPLNGVLAVPVLTWHHWLTNQVYPASISYDLSDTLEPGFAGQCSVGGVHYTSGSYPVEYAGAYFFGDYSADWIRVLWADAQDNVLKVREFASDVGGPVHFARHPGTGEVYFCSIVRGKVYRIRYSPDQVPVASASASPRYGPIPLTVHFSSQGSYHPQGHPITFSWDFGDGTPASAEANPVHVFQTSGNYVAVLTVRDADGHQARAFVPVASGNTPPAATILSPGPGTVMVAPGTAHLVAAVSDEDDPEEQLSLQWVVDLYHDFHVHYSQILLSGNNQQFPFEVHGGGGELYYLKVTLTVTDRGGLSTTVHSWIYPPDAYHDWTVRGRFISSLDELDPPYTMGFGNPDPQILSDGDMPPLNSDDPWRQYDTWHYPKTGDDWIGYEFSPEPGEEERIVGLVFQEGMHFWDGGWFDSIGIEVRTDGVWNPVQGLHIVPGYPLAPGSNLPPAPDSFRTFAVHFDPVYGDAVRLRGAGGGLLSYITAAELRVKMLSGYPPTQIAQSPGDAKMMAEGGPVTFAAPLTVSLVSSPSEGFFYAQDALRSSGIRVQTAGLLPEVGDSVLLSGRMTRNTAGEWVLSQPTITRVGTAEVRPLSTEARSLLRGASGVGLSAQGVLMRLAGRVHHVNQSLRTMWIDDGSLASTRLPPLLKVAGIPWVPAVNSYVTVTGVPAAAGSGFEFVARDNGLADDLTLVR